MLWNCQFTMNLRVQVKNVFELAILGEMSATLGQLYIMPFGAAEPKKDAVPQKTD